MKIAVTFENGNVFQHFGHTDNKVVNESIVDTNGSGHGALAGFLKENSVDTLICGGIGNGAKQALAEAGIKLYGGVTGNADGAVNDLLQGKLNFNENVHCEHHDHSHHEGHCGEHKNGCSGNK